MSGSRDEDKGKYDEGKHFALSGGDDLDEIAGSAEEGDEIEYVAQEWADDE